MRATPDCFEAVAEVDEAMKTCLNPGQRYYVLGGIVSSAIRHEDTEFDFDTKSTIPTKKAAEPLLREENQTVRDIDVFVDDVLPREQKDDILAKLDEATPLEVSVFGFDTHSEEEPRGFEKLFLTVADWTSRRTIDAEGVIRYELFPLEQIVQTASFEPWTLILPEAGRVNTFNPAGHTLAYRMRSISGVRFKDTKKLNQMTDRIKEIPQFMDEIREGMFKEWNDFALGIYDILEGKIGLDDPRIATSATERDLALFAFKGRALEAFESNETIIKLAQTSFGEKVLSPFTRSK